MSGFQTTCKTCGQVTVHNMIYPIPFTDEMVARALDVYNYGPCPHGDDELPRMRAALEAAMGTKQQDGK